MNTQSLTQNAERTESVSYDITSATLKWIALITMFVDHIGLALIAYAYHFIYKPTDPAAAKIVYDTYLVFRGIGRASFPLFVFLLIEGFIYTKDKLKYMQRLLAFTVISELPFDMAFTPALIGGQGYIYFGYQNVFFTLSIGFAAMWIIDSIYNSSKELLEKAVYIAITALIAANTAYLLRSDYAAWGVTAIMAGYFVKKVGLPYFWEGFVIIAILVAMKPFELWAVAVLPLFTMYHGNKGRRGNRYVFYVAYPAHLLLLYIIRMILW